MLLSRRSCVEGRMEMRWRLGTREVHWGDRADLRLRQSRPVAGLDGSL